MKYEKGYIVIVKFPFIKEGHEIQKGRPALVINNTNIIKRYDDIILAAISSRIPSNIMEMEIILKSGKSTGLIKKSLLRLDFIMTIPVELISRKIGSVSEKTMETIDGELKKLFGVK